MTPPAIRGYIYPAFWPSLAWPNLDWPPDQVQRLEVRPSRAVPISRSRCDHSLLAVKIARHRGSGDTRRAACEFNAPPLVTT
jgi:hypothetical protein